MEGNVEKEAFTIITQREGRPCRWCDRAKALLTERGEKFAAIPLTDGLLNFFDAMGFATVPQIWHGTKHIGGYTELAAYIARTEIQ